MVSLIQFIELCLLVVFCFFLTWSLRTVSLLSETGAYVKGLKTGKLGRGGEHTRLIFFDSVKGIAIISVLVIHLSSIVPQGAFLRSVLEFAVPFFFMASGYLLVYNKSEEKGFGLHLLSVFWRVGLIYVIFTVLVSLYLNGSLTFSFFLDLLLGRASYHTYYFIPVLISLYVLYPFFRWIQKQTKDLLFLMMSACAAYFSHLWLRSVQIPEWNSHEWAIAFFGPYVFYFAIGLVLGTYSFRDIRLKHLVLPFSVYLMYVTSLFLLDSSFYFGFLYPVVCFLFVLVLYNYLSRIRLWNFLDSSVFSQLGQYSLVIYLSHIPVQVTLRNFLEPSLESYSWLFFGVLIFSSLVICYGIARLFMFGYRYILHTH